MPVAISPVDRQRDCSLERRHQLTVLVVDGAAAVKVVVVLGYFDHPLARDVSATQHILEKGHYIFWFFRAAEGEHQGGIVGDNWHEPTILSGAGGRLAKPPQDDILPHTNEKGRRLRAGPCEL
jgi:hypothetical protein